MALSFYQVQRVNTIRLNNVPPAVVRPMTIFNLIQNELNQLKKVPSTGTGNNDQANDQNQVRGDTLEDDNSDKDSLKEEKENQGGAGQGQGGQGGEDGSQHAPSPFSMLQAKLEQVLIAIVVPIVFIPIVFVTIVIISSAIKF